MSQTAPDNVGSRSGSVAGSGTRPFSRQNLVQQSEREAFRAKCQARRQRFRAPRRRCTASSASPLVMVALAAGVGRRSSLKPAKNKENLVPNPIHQCPSLTIRAAAR
jgi:hypothetical protein